MPETRYAKSGDVHIAYQVSGDGPLDVVVVPGFISNVELAWDMPFSGPALRRSGLSHASSHSTNGEPVCPIGRSEFPRSISAWTTCGP
jgi:hypothetical protein